MIQVSPQHVSCGRHCLSSCHPVDAGRDVTLSRRCGRPLVGLDSRRHGCPQGASLRRFAQPIEVKSAARQTSWELAVRCDLGCRDSRYGHSRTGERLSRSSGPPGPQSIRPVRSSCPTCQARQDEQPVALRSGQGSSGPHHLRAPCIVQVPPGPISGTAIRTPAPALSEMRE